MSDRSGSRAPHATFSPTGRFHFQKTRKTAGQRQKRAASEKGVTMDMRKAMISALLGAALIAAGIPATAQTAQESNPSNSGSTTQNQPMMGWHGHRGAKMKQNMRQMMIQKLNLSEQQQEELKPIFQNQRQQAMAIRQDNSLTPAQKMEKLQALRQDTQSKINGVLTPEQQQQWAQLKTQFRTNARHRMQARMAKKLNLTPQQQEQMKPIMQKQREQARAIWQDNSLTQQQKKEKLQALHKDTMAQMDQILTPEQQQQMQQMRQRMWRHRQGQGPAANTQPSPQG
jgi:Spy/CpxP family protein refolding chaperone